MSSVPKVGTRVLILTKANIKYRGILTSIDHAEQCLVLDKVAILGQKDGEIIQKLPQQISFSAGDIKTLAQEKSDTSPTQTKGGQSETQHNTTGQKQSNERNSHPPTGATGRLPTDAVDALTGDVQNLSFSRNPNSQKANGSESLSADGQSERASGNFQPPPPIQKPPDNAPPPGLDSTRDPQQQQQQTTHTSSQQPPRDASNFNTQPPGGLGTIGETIPMKRPPLHFESDSYRPSQNPETAGARPSYDPWNAQGAPRDDPSSASGGAYLAGSDLYSPFRSGPSDPWNPKQGFNNGGWENTPRQEDHQPRDRFAAPPQPQNTSQSPHDSFYDREFRDSRDNYRYENRDGGGSSHNRSGPPRDFQGGGGGGGGGGLYDRSREEYYADDRRGQYPSSSSNYRGDRRDRGDPQRPQRTFQQRRESPPSRAMESQNWRRDIRRNSNNSSERHNRGSWQNDGSSSYTPERSNHHSWEKGRFPSKRGSPAWQRGPNDRRRGNSDRRTHRPSGSYRSGAAPGTGGFLDKSRNRGDFRDTPEDDFDFESSNQKFDKEAFAHEQLKLHAPIPILEFEDHREHENSTPVHEDNLQDDISHSSERSNGAVQSPESIQASGDSGSNGPKKYDAAKSFFDDISTDPKRTRTDAKDLIDRDRDTFGSIADKWHHRGNGHRRNNYRGGGGRRYNNYRGGDNYRRNNYDRYRNNNRNYRPRNNGGYEQRDFDRRRNAPNVSGD